MPQQNPGATGPQLTRRQLIQYSAIAAAGITVGTGAASPGRATAAPLGGRIVTSLPAGALEGFTAPTAATAPRFRWWWPNGQVDLDEIAAEVGRAADAGFGGLEISNVHHSVTSGLDVVNYGWGGTHWAAAMETALTAAQRHGIQIDVTVGPSWPAAVPSITPQSEAAIKELAHGSQVLAPGERFSGALPAVIVPPAPGVTDSTLIAVQAAEIVTSSTRVTVLRRTSVVDLTAQVSGGTIDWTAPTGGGSWVLLAYWQRGSGQTPEGGPHTDPPSYVVDHFGQAGAQAVIDYWEQHILTDSSRKLLGKVGGTFFEDSLEIETKATLWTADVVAQFRTRIGYDPMPYLPVLVEVKEKYLYSFDDIVTTRVQDDYNQVLSDLYAENHLIPLRDWAHSLGMEYRVQVYGLPQDSIQEAGIVDIPETESLGAKNVDDYRVLASAGNIAGRALLSCESSAYLNKAYLSTWRNDVLYTLAETFCGGVNQTVFHGYPYATAPGATWPGFAAFSPYHGGDGYSEAWGPRMPVWNHLPPVAAAIARIQWVLRQGRARYDIAFYRQKGWTQTGIGSPWGTASGIPVGWTQGFLDESSLFQPLSVLKNGRFAPQGGDYRAFVIDIDRFRGNEATMSVRAGEKLLELAGAGFPLVLFGDWSNPASTGLRDAAVDARVAAIVTELKSLPSVAQAAGNDDIPVALAALGVNPAVSHAFSFLKHIHRVDDEGVDYYYLVNAKHNPAKDKLVPLDQQVQLTATTAGAVPYVLDAWTGRVRRLPAYTRRGATVTVRVKLQPAQSTVVVLAPEGWVTVPGPRATVVSTTADDVSVSDNGSIFLQAAEPGTYTATLDTGRSVSGSIPALPAPLTLTDWSLSVDDWQPVAIDGTATKHVQHDLQLTALAPWSQLGMPEVAGIGDYRATFTLDAAWRSGDVGVLLSLGSVLDTFRVWVNGTPVSAVDLTSTTIDVSSFVVQGSNTLRVEVASPLINRLRLVTPAAYGGIPVQDYGLMGPVMVSAYGRIRIA